MSNRPIGALARAGGMAMDLLLIELENSVSENDRARAAAGR